MKQFLIIGNGNAVTYKEIFPLIKENKLWLGTISNKTMEFTLDDSYEKWNEIRDGKILGKVPAISWFTNLPHTKRNTELDLYKKYNAEEYPKYDNYDAIEVNKTTDIPMDYNGVMGVPITFLDKYCPTQFEIIGMAAGNSAVNNFGADANYVKNPNDRGGCGVINGERVYARILIRAKRD